MDTYQQFCPVAMAAEIVTLRWMPLVLRELLCGSVRFNDIHRGIPRMSRSLLSKRLDELEQSDLLTRTLVDGHPEYHLTRAGEGLGPVIEQLGVWGKRWAKADISRDRLDVGFLMWDIHRRIARNRLPARRVVVEFHFTDAPEDDRLWWLLLEPKSVDLCLEDPGYGWDLEVTTDVRTLVDVWMGDAGLARELRDETIRLTGPRELRRQFPGWLQLSMLAGVPREGGPPEFASPSRR